MIFLFKLVSRLSAEMLSSASDHKEIVICLTEKISVLHKLSSVMSLWVREFNVNELHKVYLNSSILKTRLCIDWLMNI